MYWFYCTGGTIYRFLLLLCWWNNTIEVVAEVVAWHHMLRALRKSHVLVENCVNYSISNCSIHLYSYNEISILIFIFTMELQYLLITILTLIFTMKLQYNCYTIVILIFIKKVLLFSYHNIHLHLRYGIKVFSEYNVHLYFQNEI